MTRYLRPWRGWWKTAPPRATSGAGEGLRATSGEGKARAPLPARWKARAPLPARRKPTARDTTDAPTPFSHAGHGSAAGRLRDRNQGDPRGSPARSADSDRGDSETAGDRRTVDVAARVLGVDRIRLCLAARPVCSSGGPRQSLDARLLAPGAVRLGLGGAALDVVILPQPACLIITALAGGV